MKVETAIGNACLELKKKSIRSPLLDSEILMAKVFNKSREFVLLNSKEIIKQNHYFYFQKLIEERLRGKPVAYIIGKKSFWNYNRFYFSSTWNWWRFSNGAFYENLWL